jgi:hypothetical protein
MWLLLRGHFDFFSIGAANSASAALLSFHAFSRPCHVEGPWSRQRQVALRFRRRRMTLLQARARSLSGGPTLIDSAPQ